MRNFFLRSMAVGDIIFRACPCLSLRETKVQREEVKYVRSYEMVVILQADLEDHKAVSEEIAEVVRGLGAEVEKIDLWGKKRFCYPIEKQLEGFYILYSFKLDPAQVKEMDRLMGLKQQVLRHLIVNLEED